jgi:hypothetical protein
MVSSGVLFRMVNPNPPLNQVAPPPPPPGGAAAATGAPPSRPSAERPDDLLTIRHASGATEQVTRERWLANGGGPQRDATGEWTVVNAQAAPPPPPAPPAPPPSTLASGLGPAYMQAIKQHQAGLGRPMTINDFYALADPSNGLGLGAVKEVRAPSAADIPQFGAAPPLAVVEYANGMKLGISAPPDSLVDGGAGVTAEQITGFAFDPPKAKSPLQEQAELDQARAQARLATANAAHREALNRGVGTRDVEAQIAQARAGVAEAGARTQKIEQELASGKTEAEVAQIVGATAATLSQAQSAATNAATGQGRLVLDATLGEIDRRYKEGLIDNETRRILSNHAWQRWQADNTNTQTVVAAAGKGLEADLTERNQNIALDNTRLNAANSGFSDDSRTATSLNEWMDQGSDSAYWMLKGLQGMRTARVKDWGGLQEHAPVRRPEVLEQLGYRTPIALRSLETVDDIERQKEDIRSGRAAAGIMTEPVRVPVVAPAPLPAVVRPAAAAPAAPAVVRPAPPPTVTPEQAEEYRRNNINPATGEPISQSHIQSNLLVGSSLAQPVRYAQGGTPIAVRDLFGRARPVAARHAWLG